MAKKENTFKAHIIPRSGTAADWTLVNPVLLAGEMGVESDTGRFKFGNGANPWNELPYSGESGSGLTEIPVATEDTVGGFKSNPNGDTGAVEIQEDGTAKVNSVQSAAIANTATKAVYLANKRTISLSGEASGSVETNFLSSPTIPVTLDVPVATSARVGGIRSGSASEIGSVVVDANGNAKVNKVSKLGTGRKITLTNDVEGTGTFDGGTDISISTKVNSLSNGLVLPIKRAASTTYLTENDCVVFVTGQVYIYLPQNPKKGQTIFIKNIVSGAKTTLNIGKAGHYINDGIANSRTSWAWTEGCFFMFIWDDYNTWQASYMRYN